jgi:hypothetical protein
MKILYGEILWRFLWIFPLGVPITNTIDDLENVNIIGNVKFSDFHLGKIAKTKINSANICFLAFCKLSIPSYYNIN